MSLFDFFFVLGISSWNYLLLKVLFLVAFSSLLLWLITLFAFKIDKTEFPLPIKMYRAISNSLIVLGVLQSLYLSVQFYFSFPLLTWNEFHFIPINVYIQLLPHVISFLILSFLYHIIDSKLISLTK